MPTAGGESFFKVCVSPSSFTKVFTILAEIFKYTKHIETTVFSIGLHMHSNLYLKRRIWTHMYSIVAVDCLLCVGWHNGRIFLSVCVITCWRYIIWWWWWWWCWQTRKSSCVSSRWAWVLQDALGIAFCLYMLKTVRLPTFKVGQHS